MRGTKRITVCCPGSSSGFLELPASHARRQRAFVSGGERSLYELATAAASLGHDVELRGEISQPVLATITAAAGSAPRTGMPARPAEPGEIVVLPEGLDSPHPFLAATLSGARPVVALLAPPGLFGWSFRAGWSRPDPLTVPLDAVGTAESFQAIDRFGFTMWTNAYGIAAAGRRSGVKVSWLGTGTPVPFADEVEKTHDVAVVVANRWREDAESVAHRLGGASLLRVSATGHTYSLGESLAPARILVWPSRIEGMSRISREARGAGTVPVMLDTNPFAEPEDYGAGVLLVSDLDQLVENARRLLSDPDELESLASAGRESARDQADWSAYRSRLAAAIEALDTASPHQADRLEIGRHLRETVGQFSQRYESHLAELRAGAETMARVAERDGVGLAWAETLERVVAKSSERLELRCAQLAEAQAEVARARAEEERLAGELDTAKRERDAARSKLDALPARRPLRLRGLPPLAGLAQRLRSRRPWTDRGVR